MFKSKQYFSHWIREIDFPAQVSIYSCFVNDPIDPNVLNVLNLVNEPEITRMKNGEVIQLANKFNLILTWNEELLEKLPNSRLMFCGMTWIPNHLWETWEMNSLFIQNKQFKVSFICGTKNLSYNHTLRHHLWNKFYDIHASNVYFFNSSHNPMPNNYGNLMLGINPRDKLEALEKFQYHIAIENVCQNNYFSEKIIDCFITKTIPIYLGCKNIGNFFDERGIIQVNGVDEIINMCNELNPSFYESRLEYVKENYNLSLQYARDFTDRLKDKINEFFMWNNGM